MQKTVQCDTGNDHDSRNAYGNRLLTVACRLDLLWGWRLLYGRLLLCPKDRAPHLLYSVSCAALFAFHLTVLLAQLSGSAYLTANMSGPVVLRHPIMTESG